MEFSKTQLSNYAKIITGFIMIILPIFGVTAEQDQVTFIIFGILFVCFSIYSFIQRFQKGDLTLGGIRITK